jgi:hypothetical protein
MSARDQLLGVWKGHAMTPSDARSYDVLVFHNDGTGFLDLYDTAYGFTERFRWELEPGGLRLLGERLVYPHPLGGPDAEQPSALNALTAFSLRDGNLQFSSRPWPGMSERYLHYRRDIPMHATFQARRFDRPDEPAGSPFRGTALSDFLAEQLRARGLSVGPRVKVYFGCCYYRTVEVRGTALGLGVNASRDDPGWWLCIDRPPFGGEAEAEELHRVVHGILDAVEGLRGLRWQTEDEWHAESSVTAEGQPP